MHTTKKELLNLLQSFGSYARTYILATRVEFDILDFTQLLTMKLYQTSSCFIKINSFKAEKHITL